MPARTSRQYARVGETERESGDRIKVHHQPEKFEEEEENKTEFQFVAFLWVVLASAIIQFSRFVELTQVSINLPGTTRLQRRSSTVVYIIRHQLVQPLRKKTWPAIGLFIVALR